MATNSKASLPLAVNHGCVRGWGRGEDVWVHRFRIFGKFHGEGRSALEVGEGEGVGRGKVSGVVVLELVEGGERFFFLDN